MTDSLPRKSCKDRPSVHEKLLTRRDSVRSGRSGRQQALPEAASAALGNVPWYARKYC